MKIAVLSLSLVLCSGAAWIVAAPADTPTTFTLEALASPAPRGSMHPRLAAGGDRVVLSWIEQAKGRGTLRYAERTATGWSPARTVPANARLVVNAADVPLVQPLPNGTLVAQWVEENAENPAATAVRLAWSKNAGQTWSAPVTPHRDKTETEHGFGSVFDMGGGSFGVIWLDGRAGEDEGDMALHGTTFGADGKQGADMPIDARVCECCQTSTAVTSDGALVVYRDRSADEIRDISVSRFSNGRWSTPTSVHKDGWKIDGCPINGPSIAAAGSNVVVAWYTVQDGQARVLVAFSTDAGKTFGQPVRVDDGSGMGRVQAALLPDGTAAVSWVELVKPGSKVKVRHVTKDGARSAALTIADVSPTHYPRMAQRRGELVFAWVEQSKTVSQVRTARSPVPALSAALRP